MILCRGRERERERETEGGRDKPKNNNLKLELPYLFRVVPYLGSLSGVPTIRSVAYCGLPWGGPPT